MSDIWCHYCGKKIESSGGNCHCSSLVSLSRIDINTKQEVTVEELAEVMKAHTEKVVGYIRTSKGIAYTDYKTSFIGLAKAILSKYKVVEK